MVAVVEVMLNDIADVQLNGTPAPGINAERLVAFRRHDPDAVNDGLVVALIGLSVVSGGNPLNQGVGRCQTVLQGAVNATLTRTLNERAPSGAASLAQLLGAGTTQNVFKAQRQRRSLAVS